ncbi:unnamed protein product [Phytomonas sp. EM1]|nr:unnamed protein product [Phytomonas sp. EM1]|eukprot:CCW64065.1 unnamed protein product [Phytomonas sp. isolate EM1]
MGKPGGFFKKLKAKQKRTASQQRRGTKGASKEERRWKYNERVEYYAAKREADELDALSDSSEDRASTDSEKEQWTSEKKLRKLRNLLGVSKTPQQSRSATSRHANKSTRGTGGKTSTSEQKHLQDDAPTGEDGDSDSERSLSKSGRSSSHSSVVRSQRAERSDKPESRESSVRDDEDWETYLGRVATPTSRSANSDPNTDEDENASSDMQEDDEEEELLIDYEEDDEKDTGSGESLDLGEDEEADEEEAEANPLLELLNEDGDDNNAADDAKGEIVFEPQDMMESNEEAYVDDESDDSSDASSTSEDPQAGSVEKQRERRALLPKFKLGTTCMDMILRSNPQDRCYQKYHLDRHGGVDQTPLRAVPVPPEVLEALQHSNDALIAAVEAEEKDAEVNGAHNKAEARMIAASPNAVTPRTALAPDLLTVSAAEYRMVDPSSIAVAASAHAQKFWLHEPFAVGVGVESTSMNSRTKPLAATPAIRRRTKKDAAPGALEPEIEESRPPYVHETLWAKWVAYRRSYPRNHHFPPSPSPSTTDALPALTFEERGLLDLLQGYPDVLDCLRCWQNAASRREIFLLHILNHWFKMRAVVVAHDAILRDRHHRRRAAENRNPAKRKKASLTTPEASLASQGRKRRREEDGSNEGNESAAIADEILNDVGDGDENLELRDRGFGRTRVLVMLPMRNQAYRYVHTIVRILGADPERCPKLDNFSSDFTEIEEAVDPTFKRRPKDYQRQFEGNIDDTFCVGLRLEPDRVQVYAHPLNSDIILCSPLGLRRRLEKSGDIMVSLSSIEVCLVDEAHVLLEQNWDHAAAVLGMLNKRPTDTTHGLSDLRRVYAWALEGKSGRHRQTIFSTNISHATISSAFRASLNNSGKILLQHRVEEGVLSHVLAPVRQNFLRFDVPTIEAVDDERFDVFTNKMYPSKIHPLVERDVRTIIFVPSYFQFVRLRNYMHREYRESYAAISEYTSVKKQRQALGQFTDLERPLLLLTERFYFFRRYFVKFAEVIIFYSPPLFPDFYTSLVNRIVATSPNAFAMTLYCRYDTHELSRIVGTKRAATLLERESGIFSFITS